MFLSKICQNKEFKLLTIYYLYFIMIQTIKTQKLKVENIKKDIRILDSLISKYFTLEI